MSKIENTVFISYRRTNIGFALAVYQNLTQHGYDVFLDYTGINAGNFEQIIIENIKSRAHFIVILTPSALERVHEPGDWLRREIETAIDLKRNIVPLTFENFDWKLARENYLTGKLTAFAGYNELSVPMAYFTEAMDRLRNRYLNITLDLVLHPVSLQVEQATEAKQVEADAQPTVNISALNAEEWFERGFKHDKNNEYTEAIKAYTEVIRLNPKHATAFNNRGTAKYHINDFTDAIDDYNASLHLNSNDAIVYTNRANARLKIKDYAKALEDLDEAIRINPYYINAYDVRVEVKWQIGHYKGSLVDALKSIFLEVSSYWRKRLNQQK